MHRFQRIIQESNARTAEFARRVDEAVALSEKVGRTLAEMEEIREGSAEILRQWVEGDRP